MLTFVIGCIVLGAIAGFLAGLLGIGGGTIIVPTLLFLFPFIGIAEDQMMAMALGTSFSTIVITAFSAAHRHNKLGNVDWVVGRTLIPALMIAVFLSGLVVSDLPKALMTKVFAIILFFLAAKMIFSMKSAAGTKSITIQSNLVAGTLIGTISSTAGIGGGAFIVPYLNGRGIEMKKAIGTSSFCGALLGLGGTLSFIVSGWGASGLPAYSLGYIYLPALIAITLSSFFTSKLGANAANVWPVPILKKIFAVLLILIALNMFFK